MYVGDGVRARRQDEIVRGELPGTPDAIGKAAVADETVGRKRAVTDGTARLA